MYSRTTAFGPAVSGRQPIQNSSADSNKMGQLQTAMSETSSGSLDCLQATTGRLHLHIITVKLGVIFFSIR